MKIILVVLESNAQWSKIFSYGIGMNVVTMSRYLGVYIREAGFQEIYLGEEVSVCEGAVQILVGM